MVQQDKKSKIKHRKPTLKKLTELGKWKGKNGKVFKDDSTLSDWDWRVYHIGDKQEENQVLRKEHIFILDT